MAVVVYQQLVFLDHFTMRNPLSWIDQSRSFSIILTLIIEHSKSYENNALFKSTSHKDAGEIAMRTEAWRRVNPKEDLSVELEGDCELTAKGQS